MNTIFIDGSAGTTGLRIADRLRGRSDIRLLTIDPDKRKDPAARKQCAKQADVVFLCLPDAAAMEAADLFQDTDAVIIDASTAHRVSPDWTYGFAEIGAQRNKIKATKRIANPGCHASGFIALVAPLVETGLLPADARLSCFSLTGYSGGGKQMIADYETDELDELLTAPRLYGLSQTHKHLPEMKAMCQLENAPVFCPIVAPYHSGMEVTVPLFGDAYQITKAQVEACYAAYYQAGLVRFCPDTDENGFLSAAALAGRDCMEVTVFGNDARMTLVARFDNLGKGASGAAIQNMNLALGLDETAGLVL